MRLHLHSKLARFDPTEAKHKERKNETKKKSVEKEQNEWMENT